MKEVAYLVWIPSHKKIMKTKEKVLPSLRFKDLVLREGS